VDGSHTVEDERQASFLVKIAVAAVAAAVVVDSI